MSPIFKLYPSNFAQENSLSRHASKVPENRSTSSRSLVSPSRSVSMAVDMLPDSGKQRSFGTKLRDIIMSSGVNRYGV